MPIPMSTVMVYYTQLNINSNYTASTRVWSQIDSWYRRDDRLIIFAAAGQWTFHARRAALQSLWEASTQ